MSASINNCLYNSNLSLMFRTVYRMFTVMQTDALVHSFKGCIIFHFVNTLLWHSIPQFKNIKLLCFLSLQIILPRTDSYLRTTAYSREQSAGGIARCCIQTTRTLAATCKPLSGLTVHTPTANSTCKFLLVHGIKILEASVIFVHLKCTARQLWVYSQLSIHQTTNIRTLPLLQKETQHPLADSAPHPFQL